MAITLPRPARRRISPAYPFIAAPLLLLAVFVLIPCLWGVGLSFFHYDAIAPARFAGLANYARMAHDPQIGVSLQRTLYYVFLSVPLGVFVSLAVALVLNERWFRGKTLARAIYFLPNVVSLVAVAFIWEWIFNPDSGLLNYALQRMRLPPQTWLSDPGWAMPCVILVSVWHGLGFSVLVYLAGLQGISDAHLEAARIDGANRWQEIRHVVWPLLLPTTMFLTVMGIIGGFQAFQSVFIMTGGGPVDSTRVIVYYLWQVGFQRLEMGYASAIAMLVFAAILALTLIQWRYYGRRIDA
jgi:multiple sugar transport system permease protein